MTGRLLVGNGILSLLLVCASLANAETWVEYHRETWHHYSKKLKKKLYFTNHSYYDADSIKRIDKGDVRVVIKDVSMNDRFYVGRGVPEREVVLKQILLRCTSRRYELILEDGTELDIHESVGERIPTGSVYEKLFKGVCPK